MRANLAGDCISEVLYYSAKGTSVLPKPPHAASNYASAGVLDLS